MNLAYPVLAESEKTLRVETGWSPPDVDGEMAFVVPLEIGGFTPGVLWLRGRCYEPYPDQSVLLQLEAGRPGIRTRVPLFRLEWRPLNEPHKNPDDDAVPRLVYGTHLHSFSLNWLPANGAMRSGNLPYAVEVVPDLPDFENVLDYAGKAMRINGMYRVRAPGWERRLI